ncbi:hypothetical protein XENOCAPTIV_028925 [Xenoophorus captivus]|uniref:Uncharacterized protein n=1 Tax=Xenoophorus captivus TaxID=1517983 RepID=A0ABV0S3P6_9TELE
MFLFIVYCFHLSLLPPCHTCSLFLDYPPLFSFCILVSLVLVFFLVCYVTFPAPSSLRFLCSVRPGLLNSLFSSCLPTCEFSLCFDLNKSSFCLAMPTPRLHLRFGPQQKLQHMTPLFFSTNCANSRLCSSVQFGFLHLFSPFCFGHFTKSNLFIQEDYESKILTSECPH